MWRELLKADFGLDLPISGGAGNLETDPIVIESADPETASFVQMQVVRCIYLRLAFYWRMYAKEAFQVGARRLERLTLEVHHSENGELVSERRCFYFDISALGEKTPGTPPCFLRIGEDMAGGFPYEIGWLHFAGMTEYATPEQGISLAYGAPAIKATFYFYNGGNPVIDPVNTPELLEHEFKANVEELLSVYPAAKLGPCKRQSNLIFQGCEIGADYSIIMLVACRNLFVKARATINEPKGAAHFDFLMQSLNDFAAMFIADAVKH